MIGKRNEEPRPGANQRRGFSLRDVLHGVGGVVDHQPLCFDAGRDIEAARVNDHGRAAIREGRALVRGGACTEELPVIAGSPAVELHRAPGQHGGNHVAVVADTH